MALTFFHPKAIIIAQGDARANRHLPVVETRRLPQTYKLSGRELSPQTVGRLLVTDGLLLFIVQIQHERHDAGDGAQNPKDS